MAFGALSRRGPRLRGRREADPEGMAACGKSLEGFGRVGVALSVASVDRLCRTSGGAESVVVVD